MLSSSLLSSRAPRWLSLVLPSFLPRRSAFTALSQNTAVRVQGSRLRLPPSNHGNAVHFLSEHGKVELLDAEDGVPPPPPPPPPPPAWMNEDENKATVNAVINFLNDHPLPAPVVADIAGFESARTHLAVTMQGPPRVDRVERFDRADRVTFMPSHVVSSVTSSKHSSRGLVPTAPESETKFNPLGAESDCVAFPAGVSHAPSLNPTLALSHPLSVVPLCAFLLHHACVVRVLCLILVSLLSLSNSLPARRVLPSACACAAGGAPHPLQQAGGEAAPADACQGVGGRCAAGRRR